ncbi:MAG TPA: DUF4229 domain-containing protein [Microbacteriaceae bacterium]|nr:DUF4229 domain-containing protein [Microbacteriaceae bacterium]
MRPWLSYAIVRVGLLVIAVALMWLILGPDWATLWWLGIILAGIASWAVSYLAFGGLRRRVAEEFAARDRRGLDRDADVEDAEADDAATAGAEPQAAEGRD